MITGADFAVIFTRMQGFLLISLCTVENRIKYFSLVWINIVLNSYIINSLDRLSNILLIIFGCGSHLMHEWMQELMNVVHQSC